MEYRVLLLGITFAIVLGTFIAGTIIITREPKKKAKQ